MGWRGCEGTGKDEGWTGEGPLTLERSKTVDEEISAKVIDFLDRNDPKKTGKPFFVWYNPARMHVTTMLPDKYLAMLGERGGKDWGIPMAASPRSRGKKASRGKAATGRRRLSAGRATSSRARSRTNCLPLSTGCRPLSTSPAARRATG